MSEERAAATGRSLDGLLRLVLLERTCALLGGEPVSR